MRKLSLSLVELGATFYLKDSWCTKIFEKFGESEKCSTQFEVKRKATYGYLCEEVGSDSKNKKMIFLSNAVMNYVRGNDADNSNKNVHFCEFLPDENERIMILNAEDDTITPARFMLSVSFCPRNNICYVDFILEKLLDEEDITLNSNWNNSWKSMNVSDEYMNDIEKMYKDTFVHKECVLNVCNKFATYLKEKGLYLEANELLKRATVHDNSKITNHDEFMALASIVSDKSCLENANESLSTLKQNSIMLHWKNNSHHPEHFENYEEMTKLDRMEMACDWMARSLQYKSNLLEFAKTRQKDRFHFSDTMFEEVYNYCTILVSLYQI